MAPAFGADGIITGGAGTCIVDVLGVYDNNATANTIATWALNDYKCGAGQYLDEDTLACITCPTGSYCPGGTYTVENADEGTNACPTGYKNSDAGASADTQCYTNCKVSDIAHATAVIGNDYYGSGTDTCTATDCDLGYHVDGDLEFYEKTPLVPVDYREYSHDAVITGKGRREESGMLSVAEAGLTENNTWASKYNNGIVYGRASCQPEPGINNVSVAAMGLIMVFAAAGSVPLDELVNTIEPVYGPLITREVLELVDKLKNNLIEDADLFNRLYALFGIEKNADYRTDSTGKYCFCQVTGFKPTDGEKYEVLNAPWVSNAAGELTSCADSCVLSCINYFALEENETDMDHSMSGAMYGSFEYVYSGSGMCKITENNCSAGQYLAIVGDAMMCVPCKSGSYCPGGVYTIESENKGTNVCPAGYANSDEGASADTQCYKACTLDTANIAHATAVGGNDYFGTETDTCYATACTQGYHVNGEITLVEKTPLIPVNYETAGNDYTYINQKGDADGGATAAGLTANNTWASYFDYGTIYGRASCQPEFGDEQLRLLFYGLSSIMSGAMSIDDFKSLMESNLGMAKAKLATDLVMSVAQNGPSGLTDDEYKALFSVFMTMRGAQYDTSSTGAYCFCKADYLKDKSGNRQYIESAPWVAVYQSAFDGWNADRCAVDCAELCSDIVYADNEGNDAFRGALFGILDYAEISTCAANTINIDWNPDNGGAHTQNMCTYDGAITLPDDPVKPGFTFAGWKLVE